MAIQRYFIIFTLLFSASSCIADELSIYVNGLFKNTAVVTINGQQRVIKVGQTSPEGVKLIAANAREGVFEFSGEQHKFALGASGGLGFDSVPTAAPTSQVKRKQLSILRGRDGMFNVAGVINSTQVNFLVDTGATTIAMNNATARRIGIPYQAIGQKVTVETASGVVPAFGVVLSRVRIGDLELTNVPATIIEGAQPSEVLLGNSFLGQFKVEQDGNMMVIGTRH